MSKTREISAEEKAEIVQRCLNDEISIHAAGQKIGVSHEAVRQWLARYKTEGIAGFVPYERNRKYSPELKMQAVNDYLFKRWLKVYNAHGTFNSRKHSGGGSCMKQGRDTILEERIQIVNDWIAI